MLTERTDALIGSMLGKDYRVLKRIGEGGMAIVYLVEHQTLLKQFAAKVLSSELTSSLEARARFTQEAHSASQLDHENIVSISDFGVTVDQRPFFVMELLRGQTLDQRLAQGPMTLEEIVAISVPIAHALAYAHAEGIVHLDIKPENIFLAQRRHGRWVVKVVDFGLARTPHSSGLNKPGETSGSPMYMAPEMCRGDEDIDQRADVYSFGILLYLMTCGRLPFVDDNLQRVLQMQLVQQPQPPREINAELSPELAEIVERALAKHPDDRYPSMEALLHSLEAALPIGSDRLLIEARSGTSLRDTPFAGTLAVARQDSQRTSRDSQPPPVQTSPPSETPSIPAVPSSASIPASAVPAVPSSAVSSSRPAAPRRRLVALVLVTAVASTLVGGVVIWRQIATAPTAVAEAHHASAPAELPARPMAAVVAPQTDVAIAPPAPAPAADAPGPAPVGVAIPSPAGEDPADVDPDAAPPAATDAKEPSLRPKPVTRPPPRRGKRVAVIGSAGAPTVPLGTSSSQGSQALDAGAGSGAPEGREGSEGSGAHHATTGSVPRPVIAAPVTPTVPTGPGTLDASPAIVTLDVKGSLSPSIVRRSVDRTLASLRACYRTAARAGRATPAVELQLTFDIDENSRAAQVATRGASFGSLSGCVTGVMSKIRTSEAPDVGTARVMVVIRFRPS